MGGVCNPAILIVRVFDKLAFDEVKYNDKNIFCQTCRA